MPANKFYEGNQFNVVKNAISNPKISQLPNPTRVRINKIFNDSKIPEPLRKKFFEEIATIENNIKDYQNKVLEKQEEGLERIRNSDNMTLDKAYIAFKREQKAIKAMAHTAVKLQDRLSEGAIYAAHELVKNYQSKYQAPNKGTDLPKVTEEQTTPTPLTKDEIEDLIESNPIQPRLSGREQENETFQEVFGTGVTDYLDEDFEPIVQLPKEDISLIEDLNKKNQEQRKKTDKEVSDFYGALERAVSEENSLRQTYANLSCIRKAKEAVALEKWKKDNPGKPVPASGVPSLKEIEQVKFSDLKSLTTSNGVTLSLTYSDDSMRFDVHDVKNMRIPIIDKNGKVTGSRAPNEEDMTKAYIEAITAMKSEGCNQFKFQSNDPMLINAFYKAAMYCKLDHDDLTMIQEKRSMLHPNQTNFSDAKPWKSTRWLNEHLNLDHFFHRRKLEKELEQEEQLSNKAQKDVDPITPTPESEEDETQNVGITVKKQL